MTLIDYEKLVNQILDKSLDLDKLTEMVSEEQKRRKEQEKTEKRKAEVAKCQKALVDAVYDWVCLTDFEEGKRPPAGSIPELMIKQKINYVFDELLEDTDFKDVLSDMKETREKKEGREPDTLDINDLNTDPIEAQKRKEGRIAARVVQNPNILDVNDLNISPIEAWLKEKNKKDIYIPF